jgi:tetratricopeptide (TPR) repeat protein
LLGKWHYEVCQLNFFEKAAVDILFDGLPPASYTASINYYEKSISLSPDFVLYVLDYAKTLKAMGKKDMAIAQLNKLIRMKPIRQDDANYMKEGAIILKKLL